MQQATAIHPENVYAQPRVAFGKHADAYLRHYANMPDRDLFFHLINVDEFPSVGPKAQQLVEQYLQQTQAVLADPSLPPHLQAFTYTPEAFAQRMQVLHQQLCTAKSVPDYVLQDGALHQILKQHAPLALLDGCWLQNISLTATNHTAITTRLFHIYADKIGDGETARHYGNLYRSLLNSMGVELPEVATRLFSSSSELMDTAFSLPVFQLALSLFPRVYLSEILGFTLGHYFNPQDRLLMELAGEMQAQGLDTRYCQRYALGDAPSPAAQHVCATVSLYLAGFTDETERQQHWQRIWSGLLAHTVVAKPWLQDLQQAMTQPVVLTPQQKMVALMHAKAVYARNMHRNRKLGGQLINDWFAQEPFDAEGFLSVLAASPYVNIQEPHKSALLTRSINFGGPMFRIFTDEEQAVMTEWVESLAAQPPAFHVQDEQPSIAASGKGKPVAAKLVLDEAADLATYAKCSKRELYHYFVNADLYPDVLPTARKVAQQFFRSARDSMGKRSLPEHLRLFEYTHEAFDQRIMQIYEMETGAYENFVPPSTVPREIMVWFVQQYAPFPMVDGSWVQNIARAGMSHTAISARLFRIYSDEVGNADTVKNHPNVYRELLEKEGIQMPPTDAMAFPMQAALRDFVFDLPLLTMSVAMFPKAFLPEIIGVNLAIELSGLGKGYMQIIDELRYWKMDPYFFTLHLTIDNIASGHTAVAMETVHLYLDQILAVQGQQAMQREWERIWVGYLAFRQNMTRFDSTLERQASMRFLIPLIRQNLHRSKEQRKRKSIVAAG